MRDVRLQASSRYFETDYILIAIVIELLNKLLS